MARAALLFSLLVTGLALTGCSSVGGSALRTGPVSLPSYVGAVAVYAVGQAPPGAVDLGVVEVHAAQQEATIETLMPQFVARVAQIGGNVAVVDGVRARFEVVGRSQVESFYYTCNMGSTCGGTRVYQANEEVMIVSVFGHAYSTRVLAPGEQPLIPPGPVPDGDEPAIAPTEEP
ncbi:MAG: hypothetical protein JWP97_6056 [Labilithrix sp.]|nr:hypothetical protein [Labilithrix sp.]